MRNIEFIKQTFNVRFKEICERFEDDRELFFPEYEEDGIIPHFLFKQNALIQENWTEDIIEIRFNEKMITSYIIDNAEWDIEFIERYVQELANHEYGHTITLESVFYLYPKDTRYILINKLPNEITEEDLRRCFTESKCFYPNVHKIDLNFFETVVFLDYWANLKVRYEIDHHPPEALLRDRLEGSRAIIPFHMKKESKKYFLELLLYSQIFFIHDKWDMLVGIYHESELDQLLHLYKIINSFFDKIIEINEDFDPMEDLLFDLIKSLERLNYLDIILENRLNNQDKGVLRSFINRLRSIKT